jgi:hypothetical protein
LLRTQYGERKVAYLLGEDDNDPAATSLDTRCAAEIQGEHRLERGQRYHASLGHLYDASIYDRHTLTTIPGAGHGPRATYTSPEGLAVLFATNADNTSSDEPEAKEPDADGPDVTPIKPGKGLGRTKG